MSDNRPIVYQDGEWIIYRASSIGKPVRCLAAAREGATPLPAPQYLIEAAEAGNQYEAIVKDRLRAEGWHIPEDREQEFVEVVVREATPGELGIKVRGHLDGFTAIAPDDTTDTMLEVKSMSARVFDEWVTWGFERFPEYKAQVSTYMLATGKPATYAVVCRDDPDGEERMLLKRIETPPVEFDTLAQKTLIVEAFYDRGTLPTCDGTSKYACPYEYLCDRQAMHFAELEDGDEETFRRLLANYAEVTKLLAELEANRDNIKAELVTAMGSSITKKVDGWRINQIAPGVSRKLDSAKLRAKLGDELDEFYNEVERSGYLRITPPSTSRL